uniref:Uncharacterized protein n=1 Tax=Vespula pensylvanica TaxID=30213 RepID=A0A834UAC7_VESPE|nr:hypothetical protein H0235_008046 [Vespula pensylvanica]
MVCHDVVPTHPRLNAILTSRLRHILRLAEDEEEEEEEQEKEEEEEKDVAHRGSIESRIAGLGNGVHFMRDISARRLTNERQLLLGKLDAIHDERQAMRVSTVQRSATTSDR